MKNKAIIYGLLAISTFAFAEDYTWVQYADHGKILARSVSKQPSCPEIIVDHKKHQMKLRTSLSDIELKEQVQICEFDVTNANLVKINGKQLKLPATKATRFIVIGDTGCENSFFEPSHRKQKCDSQNWPFEKIANKVASLHPDFIIHMGDYIYRNKHHTEDDAKNTQMQWYFYHEDFFKPAKKLLKSAPMIFIRGNHESCSLSGDGWFALLDPRGYAKCQAYTDSYNISINDLNLIVFDSSRSELGKDYSKIQLEKFSQDFAKLYENIATKHWLLIHQPVIALKSLSADEAFPEKMHALVIEDAFKNEYMKKIPVSISGHYHAWDLTERTGFTQMIVGNSGSLLHKAINDSYNVKSNNGLDKNIIKIRFGYTVFDRLEEHLWKATSYDVDGNIMLVANLSTR